MSNDAETYRTVAGRGQAAFEIQGSEFVGHAAPAADREEAEEFVAEVRAEYDDATHNVPAYRVRESGGGGERASGSGRASEGDRTSRSGQASEGNQASESGRVSESDQATGNATGGFLREYGDDDGEPSGSAGKPALNVLQREDVENVVAVVTRYYGGTNLGVGGLARAYSRAVKEAVEAAGIVEERPHERFSVTVEYDDSGTVRGILESASAAADTDTGAGVEFDADYGERVTFEVRVPEPEAEELRDRIRSATSGRAEIGVSTGS